MRFPFARLRLRGLFLTAMIAVVAVLVWRGARMQREASSAAVAAWLRDLVLACQDDRDAPLAAGDTEPVVASALAGWVRASLPAGIASEAAVTVTPVAGGVFGGEAGEATHRAAIRLRGASAEADVRWTEHAGRGAVGAIVAFRPGAAPR